jgi:superfamily I DNA/RNA helicase
VSLKALGIKVTGRSTKMRKNYRSTQEILGWAVSLLARRPVSELSDAEQNETLFGYQSALHGSTPLTYPADDTDEELGALAEQIREWTSSGVQPGDIGIAARFNKGVDDIVAHLEKERIPGRRLRSDSAENADAVSVGTMHAFKGLEYRCVGAYGVHDGAIPNPKAVTDPQADRLQHETDMMAERCLLFVACTRAREQLYVSWTGKPSPFLSEAGVA